MKPAVAGGTAPFNGRLHGRCTRGLSKARIAMKTNKMDGALRRKLSAVLHLSNAESACIEAMQKGVKCIAAGTEFVRDGEPYDHPYIVKDSSEERRDGKEGDSTCRHRWSP